MVRAVNDLYDSLAMLSKVESYRHLRKPPLVPAEQIKAELESPEARAWFKAALA